MNNEQTVTLLRQNKRKQVDALSECGFTGLGYDMKASLMPTYIKWAQGLLDVTVAAYRGGNPSEKVYFTKEEWLKMTVTEQDEYDKRGVRIRACGIEFILGVESSRLATSRAEIALDLTQVGYDSAYPQMWRDQDSRGNTEKLAESMAGVTANGITGSPAAEYALGYDGVANDTQWGIPMPCHARIFYRYMDEINAVINAVWGSAYALTSETHLVCVQVSASEMWSFDTAGGYFQAVNKTTPVMVRLIHQC